MSLVSPNESWVVQTGDRVIRKEAKTGAESLTDWEKLVYCLWVADYMMQSAGDFGNAEDMCPTFQKDAVELATRLGFPMTREAFALSKRKLQKEYFDRFESIVDEIKNGEPKPG